jgi:hypothetical protein
MVEKQNSTLIRQWLCQLCVLWCDTVWCGRSVLMFQRNLLPPSAGEGMEEASLKHWYTSVRVHVTSQKTEVFVMKCVLHFLF